MPPEKQNGGQLILYVNLEVIWHWLLIVLVYDYVRYFKLNILLIKWKTNNNFIRNETIYIFPTYNFRIIHVRRDGDNINSKCQIKSRPIYLVFYDIILFYANLVTKIDFAAEDICYSARERERERERERPHEFNP